MRVQANQFLVGVGEGHVYLAEAADMWERATEVLHVICNPATCRAKIRKADVLVKWRPPLHGRAACVVQDPQQGGLDRQHSAPFLCPSWQLQAPETSANISLLQSSLHSGALHLAQSLSSGQQQGAAIAPGLAPQLGLDALCTSALELGGRASKENSPPEMCIASGGGKTACQLAGVPFRRENPGGLVLGLLHPISTGAILLGIIIKIISHRTDTVIDTQKHRLWLTAQFGLRACLLPVGMRQLHMMQSHQSATNAVGVLGGTGGNADIFSRHSGNTPSTLIYCW